jgi:23S rRNA pseudouridine2605 synthase
MSDGDRIAKVLSRAGVASRREAERMIEAGRVAVNGKVIDSPALNVTASDRITVDGKPLAPPERPRLWLYHKPAGLVTTASDEKGRQTVFEALPEGMPRVMSVGRLDLTSEGLLLLTNDGEIKRRLELPSTGWLRRYRVRIKGTPAEADLEPLRRGIEVEGVRYQPMQATIDRQQGANAWLTIGLREGKNREIRRALGDLGFEVNRLIRIAYGPFRLGTLEAGAVEEVKPRVMAEQLGMPELVEGHAAPKAQGKGKKPGPKAGGSPGARPGGKPGVKSGPKPGRKVGPPTGPRPGGKPGAKTGPKPGATRSAAPSGAKPGGGRDAGPRGASRRPPPKSRS